MRLTLALALACLALALPCLAADPPEDAPALFPSDSRLARVVSVQGQRYLGEILDMAGSEARTPLTVEQTNGPWDGVMLFVRLKKLPLRHVMDALQTTLSTPFNRCEWQRDRRTGGYILRFQGSPAEGAEGARRQIRALWAEQVRFLHDLSRLPEDQQVERAATRPDLIKQPFHPSEDTRLLGRLSPDQLHQVIEGRRVELPSQTPRAGEGRSRSMEYYADWEADQLAPILWVVRGSQTSNLVGGGPPPGWADRHRDGWEEMREEARALLRRDASGVVRISVRGLAQYTQVVAKHHDVDLIVDPVGSNMGRTTGGGFLARKPQESVWCMQLMSRLTTKRCGECHLLRHVTAPMAQRSHLVPWTTVRDTRADAERNGGFLSLAHLAKLSSELSAEQCRGLSHEFPAVSADNLSALRPILKAHSAMAPERRKRLLQSDGIPLRDIGLNARELLLSGPDTSRILNIPFLRAHAPTVHVAFSIERRPYVPHPRASPPAHPSHVAKEQDVMVWRAWVPDGPSHRSERSLMPHRPLLHD